MEECYKPHHRLLLRTHIINYCMRPFNRLVVVLLAIQQHYLSVRLLLLWLFISAQVFLFIFFFVLFPSFFFSTPKVINSFLSCGTREENGKERNSRNQTTRQTKAYGHQWFIAFFSLSSLFFPLFLRNPLTLHYSIYSVRTHWQWEGGGSSKKERRRFTILGAKAKVLDCLRFVF